MIEYKEGVLTQVYASVFNSHVLICSSLGEEKLEDVLCRAERNGAVPPEGLFALCSVVDLCGSSKGCGFDSQRTAILVN